MPREYPDPTPDDLNNELQPPSADSLDEAIRLFTTEMQRQGTPRSAFPHDTEYGREVVYYIRTGGVAVARFDSSKFYSQILLTDPLEGDIGLAALTWSKDGKGKVSGTTLLTSCNEVNYIDSNDERESAIKFFTHEATEATRWPSISTTHWVLIMPNHYSEPGDGGKHLEADTKRRVLAAAGLIGRGVHITHLYYDPRLTNPTLTNRLIDRRPDILWSGQPINPIAPGTIDADQYRHTLKGVIGSASFSITGRVKRNY